MLSNIINYNVIDELRRERKIKMVLNDVGVDEYINMDMTEIDLTDKDSHKELEPKVMLAIKDKLDFRNQFAQKISIIRLDYMFRVLRQVYPGKSSISDPDAFKDKIR